MSPALSSAVCFSEQINVEEASPRVVKGSKMVLVSLLISGLLLAALLVAGYYFKTHRKSSKGVRLVSRPAPQMESVHVCLLSPVIVIFK